MKSTSLLLTCLIGLAVPKVGSAQPTITTQPQSQTNVVGTVATFTVLATGTEPLAYQWRLSTADLAGKTNDTLIVTNVQTANAGSYTVVVTNVTGAVTSEFATLTVLVPPTITKQPTKQSASLGGNATFSAVAAGTAPRFFQWRFNETNLPGKTSTSLVLTNLQLTNAGGYTVVVTNEAGSVTSQVATLTVDATFTKITTGAPVNEAREFWGCNWIDYDLDGFPDLFVTTRNFSAATRNYLFRNNGNGSFTKVTTGAIVLDAGESRSCTWGDFDNDGFPDVVVARNSGVLFYHNNGDGTFLKLANPFLGTAGVAVDGPDCADYDRDGHLDLFVPNRNGNSLLYRNSGDGTFARVTGQRIVSEGVTVSVAWGDYDNDGWPDLFASNNEGRPGFLYRNAGGGSFEKILTGSVATQAGDWNYAAWGDYNNDGLLDLLVPNGGHHGAEKNALYRNNGDATFTAITTGDLVTEDSNFHGGSWGDYDNDGFQDLFVSNVMGNNFLYHNNGDGTFQKIVEGSLVNDGGFSTGRAWGDYDNDGFLDLIVANGGINGQEKNFLYRNNGNGNAWIKVRCVGTVSNRSAIGAKVRVRATINGNTVWQLREISSISGLMAHFGLGNATNIEALRIEWPSGIVQEFHDVTPKQLLTLTEPARLHALGAGVLRIQSWKGMAFDVQTSTNLDQWSPLTTVTNLTGTLEFTDPNAANDLQRFYRTVLR